MEGKGDLSEVPVPAMARSGHGADGTFTDLPNPNSQDGDSVTYRAYDGKAWSAPVPVTTPLRRRCAAAAAG